MSISSENLRKVLQQIQIDTTLFRFRPRRNPGFQSQRRSVNRTVVILDDFSRDDRVSNLGTQWRGFSDQVMGGISQESVSVTQILGRRCLRLTGDVRLENNGGFIQMALDLAPDGMTLDASKYAEVEIDVTGNADVYVLGLRTPDCHRPWQSYRVSFLPQREWSTFRFPFCTFQPHRLSLPLDTTRLRRLGVVAIGRAFHADLAVAKVALYGEP